MQHRCFNDYSFTYYFSLSDQSQLLVIMQTKQKIYILEYLSQYLILSNKPGMT